MWPFVKIRPTDRMAKRHRQYKKRELLAEIRRVEDALELQGFALNVDPVVTRWFRSKGFSVQISINRQIPQVYCSVELP